jgi:DNA-binding CsgD family transcriptional regulator
VKPRIAFQTELPTTIFADSCHAAGPLLPTLFASPVVGVAVLDFEMRFLAINPALAAMNGMPAARHIGKKLRGVLGVAASKVESAVDAVFQSRKPVSLELTAELPLRMDLGRWAENFFPIRNRKGRVTQVAAVVVETTENGNLARSMNRLVGNLLHIRSTLQTDLQLQGLSVRSANERSELFNVTIELAEQCISAIQRLCQVPRLHGSANLPGTRHLDRKHLPLLPDASNHAVNSQSRNELGDDRRLSAREHDVLQLLANGKNNKEVGASLGISVRTVEAHRARLMNKLEIHSLAHLVRFAVRKNIIEP